MITVIKALNQVTGAELILLGSLLCILIFTVVFALFKTNRSKKAILRYLVSMIIIFELCDLIWLSYLFPNGEYINRGLIGASIFLILPLFLIFLNSLLTYINKKNFKKI